MYFIMVLPTEPTNLQGLTVVIMMSFNGSRAANFTRLPHDFRITDEKPSTNFQRFFFTRLSPISSHDFVYPESFPNVL